jgi:penicillin amidase
LLITNNQNENSKKILLVVMSLLAILIGGVLYGFYLKPKYEGEVQLKSIQDQTTVYFDDFGFLYTLITL